MASVMAIGSEVIGECVEGIRVEVSREILKMALVCPGFFGLVLSPSSGLLSGCVDGNGARYWRLIYWFMDATSEIKSPCGCRGFWLLALSGVVVWFKLWGNRALSHPDCLVLTLGLQLQHWISVFLSQDHHWY